MTSLPQPEPFWDVRVHDISSAQGLSGLCVGYDQGIWRYSEFAEYIMEWLPEFSLSSKERDDLTHESAIKGIRKAARLVYQTEKYSRRGEFGELFLHAAIRSVFDSLPAISKIYYKSAYNETVKGFDCVHVVGQIGDLELWLGEVKFYKDVTSAIRDVVAELAEHLSADFLRNEFVLIGNKLDTRDDYAVAVQQLLSERRPLDEIFKRICIPVMLTYESQAVNSHQLICEEYTAAFESEIRQHYQSFLGKACDLPHQRFHLFLMPLAEKMQLVDVLNAKLKAGQQI